MLLSQTSGRRECLTNQSAPVRNRQAAAPLTATIGGVTSEVLYAGAQGLAGLDQVKLRLPLTLIGRGDVD
ncbi:MAG: hypothetical protein HOP19_13390, partial [Acidobacteria bacterium]|nr:hypothetical protein [Acidobacteriota bacterium]